MPTVNLSLQGMSSQVPGTLQEITDAKIYQLPEKGGHTLHTLKTIFVNPLVSRLLLAILVDYCSGRKTGMFMRKNV